MIAKVELEDQENRRGVDNNPEWPHFPYLMNAYQPNSVINTTISPYTLKPAETIKLEAFKNFSTHFKQFLNSNDSRLIKNYETPPKYSKTNVTKEVDVAYILRQAISNTVLQFYTTNCKLQLSQDSELCFGRPDFTIGPDGKLYIVIECNHPQSCYFDNRNELIKAFEEQVDTARPINQIVNYMINNSVKRGILTSLEATYGFETDVIGDETVIRVTDKVPSQDILKLVVFLLHRAQNANIDDYAHFKLPKAAQELSQDPTLIPPKSVEKSSLPSRGK